MGIVASTHPEGSVQPQKIEVKSSSAIAAEGRDFVVPSFRQRGMLALTERGNGPAIGFIGVSDQQAAGCDLD
jgi:hypothetical protein